MKLVRVESSRLKAAWDIAATTGRSVAGADGRMGGEKKGTKESQMVQERKTDACHRMPGHRPGSVGRQRDPQMVIRRRLAPPRSSRRHLNECVPRYRAGSWGWQAPGQIFPPSSGPPRPSSGWLPACKVCAHTCMCGGKCEVATEFPRTLCPWSYLLTLGFRYAQNMHCTKMPVSLPTYLGR